MSSLLRMTPGRLVPGRTWLVALVAIGLLTTVLSLAAAGRARTPHVASLATTAQRTAARQPAAPAAAPAAVTGRVLPASKVAAASSKSVMIMNYAFSPATLTVKVGDTVTWTNMDSAPHTVTVTSGPVKFNSGNLAQGQSFTYTFTEAGTYSYYCAVHPDMKASVTVVGSGTPSSTPSSTPTTTPTTTPTSTACGGLEAAVNAFLQHFYAAHLETSLTQQATDALNVDKYAQVHLVLVENMLAPLLGGLQSSLDAFLQHLYAAHLETSLTQQVSDATNLSQYIQTHTVLIENMVKPLVGQDLSSC
jgi:plastocyanin